MKVTMIAAAVLVLGLGFVGYRAFAGGTMSDGCGACMGGMNHAVATAPSTEPSTQKAVYVCPMHSDVVSDKPGKCPKCGMDLVKK